MLYILNKSIEASYNLVSKVVIYCDREGYEFLTDKVTADLVLVDYSLYDFDSRYWNFPKLLTYYLQEEPFLHVDIDAIVLEFDPKAEIVSEAKRGVAYDLALYPSNTRPDVLSFFKGSLTCSGILGGNNLLVFKELFETVLEAVANKDGFIVTDKSRMVIEEVIISSIISKYNIPVSYLGYENRGIKYIHFWGEDKQKNFINSKYGIV
jgi:hypothetical protein